MATLTALDIVVLLLIVLGGLAGLMRGFVTEVLSLLAWVAAIMAVRLLYPAGKALAGRFVTSEAADAILAFSVIFLVTFIAFRMVAQALGDRTRTSIVGPVDRVLGLGFGAFKGLIGASVLFLVLTLVFDVVEGGAPRPAWLRAARTGPLLEVTSKAMVDFVEKRRYADKAAATDDGKPLRGDGRTGEREKGDGYGARDRNALDKLLGGSK